MAEVPSAFTYASARGLAKFASIIANKGSFKNQTFLKEETWNELHSDPRTLTEAIGACGNRSTFSKGGIHRFGTKYFTDHEKNKRCSLYDYQP